MNHNSQTQPTWSEIARAITTKSKEDYQTKVKPKLNTGRNILGHLVVTFGRKIQSSK
jgi:hypothetical protein